MYVEIDSASHLPFSFAQFSMACSPCWHVDPPLWLWRLTQQVGVELVRHDFARDEELHLVDGFEWLSIAFLTVKVTRATETMIRHGNIFIFFELNTIECIIQLYYFVIIFCDQITMSTYYYVHIIKFLHHNVVILWCPYVTMFLCYNAILLLVWH